MPRIQLFGLGLQSRSREVTAERAQNFYMENRPMGEKSQVVAYGTPGLKLFANLGGSPNRGGIVVERVNLSYVVNRGTFYEVNNAGVATARGTIGTTAGRVSLAHNGTVVMVVDGTTGYTYDTTMPATPIAVIASGTFIANPVTCTWMDGYFITQNNSQGQISTDGTTWDALDVFTPDSNPDDMVAVIADHEQMIPFSTISTEFWNDTGATDFPFAPIVSAAAEWGLAAPWSLVKYNDSLAFLAQNRMGQAIVAKLQGYTAVKISTPDMDAIINGYVQAGMTIGDASAFSYLLGGHPMYQINFPTVGASWLYDGLTGIWSPVKSFGTTRHIADWGFYFINRVIVSDYASGKLYSLDPTVYTDNGASIEGELISGNIAMPDLERFNVDRLRLDMETGVGLISGQGSDPLALLYVSRDGGNTWGNALPASVGKIGAYKTRVEWRTLGQSDQWNFKVRITDPIKRTIVDACINPAD